MADKFPVPIESKGVEYRLKGSRGAGASVTGRANATGLFGRLGRQAAARGMNEGDEDTPGAAYSVENMRNGMADLLSNSSSPYRLRR